MGEIMKKSKIILLLSAILLIASLFAIGCGKAIEVTFNGNGGTLVSGEEVQTVKNTSEIVAPIYEKEGYTLSWDKDIATITENTTVSAVWTANVYKATFKLNDSVESPAILEGGATKDYTYDAEMQLPTPVRAGYTFLGWKLGSASGEDVANGATLKQTADFNLYASWAVNTYTVTFDINDTINAPATMEGETAIQYVYDAEMQLPTPVRAGYLFSGWRKGSDEGVLLVNGQINKIAENYTAVATWVNDAEQTFTISYNIAGGSMLEGDENPTIYNSTSADITLKNPVKTGYRFLGWTKEGASETPVKEVTITSGSAGNKSYIANWEQIVYTINFVLDAKDKHGNPLEVTLDGQNTIDSVTINACEALGAKLPAISALEISDSDYVIKAWRVVVDDVEIIIDADYLFDAEIFGEADVTINVSLKVNSIWSGAH